ncbi:hypothetical protein PAAG_01483 [Paracoccidioides lutzii Pb01]|uniref:Uncharacterized protein n=1 Tax=Paracoccidioides lutzii (strain ATCC MYA-826 / Pb01) TaxID=502779 RepID=C1GSI8_PARBA|nr:hypothetical protein PAAG_01483 [Paracoccidioides lutzii Pb01]EEH39021.1 hypothetical protein PAAG_01483 [Paracoccidioides lutzii Pb01]
MHIPSLALLALSLSALASASPSASSSLSADIFYWPLSSSSLSPSKPSRLAKISYDPTTLQSTIDSYTPPQPVNTNDNFDRQADLLRIGLYITSINDDDSPTKKDKQWVGTLSSPSIFANTQQTLTLHLDHNNHVYHASMSSSATPPVAHASSTGAEKSKEKTTAKAKEAESGLLKVEFVRLTPSPKPHLNRPVVLNADGHTPEEVVEKTFLQK